MIAIFKEVKEKLLRFLLNESGVSVAWGEHQSFHIIVKEGKGWGSLSSNL